MLISLARLVCAVGLLAAGGWPSNLRADEAKGEPSAPPLSQEYLEKWTPGGNRNDPGLPYPHVTAEFQSEDDDDWRDDRWQRTQKGEAVAHSVLLPDYEVGPKQTAVDAGDGTWLLFDLEAGTFVAATTGGELRTDEARFGMLNRPLLSGEAAFYLPAERAWRKTLPGAAVDRASIDHQGRYRHDGRVMLATRIDGVEALESPLPASGAGVVVRELEVGPHEEPMWLCVATAEEAELGDDGRRATWRDRHGVERRVELAGASAGVRFEREGSSILLRLPASQTATAARWTYVRNDGESAPQARAEATPASAAGIPDLTKLKQPSGRRWGEPLATQGVLAAESEQPYVVDRIPPPRENPFGALFFLAGIDFFPNGDAAVCTVHGDVWLVRGLDAELEHVTWQRFATGLYQPLGLEVVDEKVIVLGRDQLTRLHDENGDGEADFYESFNHDLITHGLPHAYAMRLERTPDGSFVFLCSGEGPHGSALLKLSPDGERLEALARGFRHPFGIGAGPKGEITAADNEGNWVPSSKIDLVTAGGFYGYLGGAAEPGDHPKPLRPLCFIPKVADNSSGGQFWHTSEAWGPYHRGGMFHFSWGRCTLHAVLEQHAGDVHQAATVEVPGVLLEGGPGEAEFSPRDGQLYVVGLDGWQTAATVDGSLERIRYTGQPVLLPSGFAAYDDGIELRFDVPLDPTSLKPAGAVRVEQWNYQWSSTYGSYHYSVKQPERVGHDQLDVQAARLSDDGKRLFLNIAGLQPVDQIQVSLAVKTAAGEPVKTNVYGTINGLVPRGEVQLASGTAAEAVPVTSEQLLAKENLVAWCIVPFDAKRRGPEERAAMLERLGIKRVAYDWRDEHVPQFDAELEAYKKHGIALHAFWTPVNTATPLEEPHWPLILDLAKRHDVRPELWVMLNDGLVTPLPEAERAVRAAEILAPAARAAARQGCKLGLYNHGGWFGEPDHQIAIIAALKAMRVDNVGIVYNFHHGHEQMAGFPALAKRMAPYLLTVNVNGMRAGGPKVVSFGDGDDGGAAERRMVAALAAAGYRGPIGILGHREERDVEECLREGLEGAAAGGGR
jgi:sugar phosphate isomerase/epimerase